MSVSSSTSSVSYVGNASTSTAYVVPYAFFDASDLKVFSVNSAGISTLLTLTTNYTVTGGAGSTGSVVTTAAIPATSTVIITRSVPYTQLTSYTTGDRLPADTLEKSLDRLTMQTQQLSRNTIPDTASTSGSAPYVLQASSAGASPSWVPQSSGGIAAGAITNTMLAGGITPAKLSTGGPVWDASGNLTATSFVGNITGSITGNAATATKLATARTLGLSGDVTGTASFDGSANATIAGTISNGVVTASKIAANAVTAAKLGTNEQKQICKAWVNFNGVNILSGFGLTGFSLVVTNGSSTGTWNAAGLSNSMHLGVIYFINVGGTNATLGGVNVSTVGIQITNVISATQMTFTLLAGPATSSQTVNGNGSASGYAFSTTGIRSSYNVSSITKNGTGDYTVNFATPMADALYTVSATSSKTNTGSAILVVNSSATVPQSTTAVFVANLNAASGGGIDEQIISVQVFGN